MDKKAIEPLQYDLFLKPDFEKWITSGTVRIKLRFSQPAERIRLHQVDLNIVDASIQSNGQQISPDIESQNEKQRVNFECRQKISGKATIEIDFEGKITDSLLGLYRSHYYQENKKKYILVTQLDRKSVV